MIRFACALLLLVASPSWLAAQTVFGDLRDAPTGSIHFQSYMPSGYWALANGKFDRTTRPTISGVLSIPSSTGTVPAMILQHGSGGVERKDFDVWVKLLNDAGVATFVIDGFTGRGVRRVVEDQALLHDAVSIADAFAALKLIATHPRIDATRIGIMGFSRGGLVANQTAWEPFRKAVIEDETRFVVHIALYPGCNRNLWSRHHTGAPMFMLLGARDDYTPASACRAYAKRMQDLGVDVSVVEYPDAYHAFDAPYAWRYDPRAQTTRECPVLENEIDAWQWRVADTGRPVRDEDLASFFEACVSRGASYGANHASNALQHAKVDVTRIVRRAFALPM